MSNTSATANTIYDELVFPQCAEWYCADYFTPFQIVLLFLLFGRVVLAIVILLLGFRMEKDFMRTITTAIFIPMIFCEIFNVYCEVVAYINLFTPTKEQYFWIKATYLEWTHSLLYVIYNYVHYNVLVLMILMLYCCRLAYQREDRINAFPLNTICLVVQIIPFFLSVLYYVTDGTTEIALRILSIASRVFMIVCFVVINLQILSSFLLLCRELPYTHANSTDMQLRDARSRLSWTLIYIIFPYFAFLPFLINAFAWLITFSGNPNEHVKLVQKVCMMVEFIFHFHRPLWMTVITLAFLPPYRRAFVLTVFCCGCCPKINIDPLPRKTKDMSIMYRYADI